MFVATHPLTARANSQTVTERLTVEVLKTARHPGRLKPGLHPEL
ncbi:hypothetical protein AB0L65_05960 [Nonomuraea sp. NPDC052116]